MVCAIGALCGRLAFPIAADGRGGLFGFFEQHAPLRQANTLTRGSIPRQCPGTNRAFKASIAEPEIQAGAHDAEITDRVDIAKSQVFNAHRHGVAEFALDTDPVHEARVAVGYACT